jgi:hypothetical protein
MMEFMEWIKPPMMKQAMYRIEIDFAEKNIDNDIFEFYIPIIDNASCGRIYK